MIGALAAYYLNRFGEPEGLVHDRARCNEVQNVAMLATGRLVDQAHQVPSASCYCRDRALEKFDIAYLEHVLGGRRHLTPLFHAFQYRVLDPAAVVAVPQISLSLVASATIPFAFLFAGDMAGEPYSGRKFFLSASPRVIEE